MSRWYDTTFRTPKGYVTVRSQGNTRRAAIGWARGELRKAGYDLDECGRIGNPTFVAATDTSPRRTGIIDKLEGA